MALGRKLENRLKTHRFANGQMSQMVLAERAGVSRQTIIAIERGAYSPSVELALRIAAVFHVKVEELFYLAE